MEENGEELNVRRLLQGQGVDLTATRGKQSPVWAASTCRLVVWNLMTAGEY